MEKKEIMDTNSHLTTKNIHTVWLFQNMYGTVKTKSNKPPKYPGKSLSLHLHTQTPQEDAHFAWRKRWP